MNEKSEKAAPKPRLALAIATGLGVGYAPVGPGTYGSLLGVAIAWLFWAMLYFQASFNAFYFPTQIALPRIMTSVSKTFALEVGALATIVSLIGVWAAGRAGKYLQNKDPQIVVIDEVAGQLLSYLGLAFGTMPAPRLMPLLGGFILFRIFDIWKPFPIRRLETLPGGWGIMADDWLAGVYAAAVLALARHFGL